MKSKSQTPGLSACYYSMMQKSLVIPHFYYILPEKRKLGAAIY